MHLTNAVLHPGSRLVLIGELLSMIAHALLTAELKLSVVVSDRGCLGPGLPINMSFDSLSDYCLSVIMRSTCEVRVSVDLP